MTVLLRRKISYHLLQTYLPSGLFVIVAWLSLFLPPESIPGRVTMAMTTLLTLAAMFGAVRYNHHFFTTHIKKNVVAGNFLLVTGN